MRRRVGGREGQALVELALVLPLVLGCLFFMLDGLLFVSQRSEVVAATQAASRLAAGSTGAAAGSLEQRLAPLLQPGLVGNRIDYADAADRGSCPPSPGESGHLVVCAFSEVGSVSRDPSERLVVVRIYGRLPAFFPGLPAFPVDEQSAVHALTFHR